MKNVTDHQTYLDFLTSFVAMVKTLTPGNSLVIPAGWKGGNIVYVLHCNNFETFTLAVCSTGEVRPFTPGGGAGAGVLGGDAERARGRGHGWMRGGGGRGFR